ncbi:MAG: hypothetical protein JWR09_4052 [Mucilaginibacter sp.]|nr:hypothetical protein [Mucilaginibacter sp.]
MKLKIKGMLMLLTSATLFYAACKKGEKLPAPVIKPVTDSATLNMEAITSQVAVNFAQSFNGTYGGININDGIGLPDFATVKKVKPVITDANQLCSFFPDTAVSISITKGDTLKAQTDGFFKFFITCDSAKAKGYSVFDSLATTGKGAKNSFAYNVSQYYVVKSLNAANTLLSVNGNSKSFVDLVSNDASHKPISVHSYYTLTALTFDLSKKGDIISGVSTFQSIGANNNGGWYYAGTITFLGNHKANVLINNKTFNVDLLTGAATVAN